MCAQHDNISVLLVQAARKEIAMIRVAAPMMAQCVIDQAIQVVLYSAEYGDV